VTRHLQNRLTAAAHRGEVAPVIAETVEQGRLQFEQQYQTGILMLLVSAGKE